MSDPSVPDPARVPDFLDRLIARHAVTAPDTVRVRPRLPGPFERVEAVRSRGAEPDTDGVTARPSAAPAAAPPSEGPRPAPEVRRYTEHERTVVHTERPAAERESARATPPLQAEPPLLRPAAPATAGPHPARGATRATGRPGPDTGGDRAAASTPAPLGVDAAPAAVVPMAARPSAADTTAARTAVRQTGRRTGRTPEQVVRVQIGRLEVTAARPPAPGGTRQGGRAAERAGSTLSLADYLARGRE
ncbi:hypothetical protein [Streptomyces hygroscopicus]|uniref:hypothetical protein n=1 Tax=Streptomyces sp. KHY 26 TaxID=3097359 RepID=UPI0025539D80|nr:hypothetical protein [Streptomyces hygroscopicus]